MGLVLEQFQTEEKKQFKAFKPDFDNATVDGENKEIYNIICEKLKKSQELISQLESWKSSKNTIREVMSNPTVDNKNSLFEEILKTVEMIKGFYNYCTYDLVTIFQQLRCHIELVEELKLDESDKFKRWEAWAKQLALLIAFVVHWDQCKMLKPSLLNDFSYYKRNLAKHANDFNLKRDDEERIAGTISFWLAESMPMCKTLGESLKTQKSRELLKKISLLCCNLVKHLKFEEETATDNNMLCLRCAVGCIVLYDRASGGSGAFGSKSFKTKKICSVLSSFPDPSNDKNFCKGLKSVIRYGCLSYGQYAGKIERRYIEDT